MNIKIWNYCSLKGIFLIITLLTMGNLFANTSHMSFEGYYNYWSDSGDYDSISIHKIDGRHMVKFKGNQMEMILICQIQSGELVSEKEDGVIYYFALNGVNELRMRKEFLRTDRPEDIEWIFFRSET